jgi:tetratricopeptide (TPR) repeat protein
MMRVSKLPEYRYYAFLSYSHQDKAWADWLHKALETYAVPKLLVGEQTAAGTVPRRLTPIFRDRDELASANDLGRKVNEALAQSANLIVICSPRSARSRWVDEEVLAFKRLGRSERIFCLIVEGEPNATDLPGRESEECFAPALRFQLGADGRLTRQPTEPIAADARAGKDGRANAKLKLIAGLLDLGFDRLKQRELQRRTRRMTLIAAAAVVLMAVTSTLAITAVIARRAADTARIDAERRQKQAEDLVSFMLGDLNDKLIEVGRLDVMQAVDDKAMAYFAALPTKDATDAALALRVTALQKIGAVRQAQGKLTEALASYKSAASLAHQLLQHAPNDVVRQAQYANSITWIGYVYWYQGDLEPAGQIFREASDLLRRAVAARPDDTELANQLSSALVNSGRVLESRGRFDEARPYFEDNQRIYEKLSARNPDNAQWQVQLAYAYNNLGKLALEQGRLDQAIPAYRADQHLKASLAARDPNNHDVQEGLLVSNAILGRTLGLRGQLDDAIRYTGQAVKSARTLMAFDPANTAWQDDFALYSQQLGGLLRQQGRLDAAKAADADALRVLTVLVSKDATNTTWQQDLAQARLEQARLQLARGDTAGAEKSAAAADATAQQLRQKDARDRSLILLAAQIALVRGQIAASRHAGDAAQRHWTQARDVVAPAAQAGADPQFLSTWASARLLLADVEGARATVEQLLAMGYRTPDFLALVSASHLPYPNDTAFTEPRPAIAR